MTNVSAMSALQTLRSISSELSTTERMVSSGLRIRTASDNAAYWSIATTMRSDSSTASAVADALGFGAAKVDVAYVGLSSVIDTLEDFKAKLVAAKEPGVDKHKIQTELDQLKQQVVSIAESASFAGQNWLTTDIEQIYNMDMNKTSVVSSFARTKTGVNMDTMDIHLDKVSLFNSTGGGLLQADPRDVKTLGGMRSQSITRRDSGTIYFTETSTEWMNPRYNFGQNAQILFDFPEETSLDFNAPGAQITFDLLVDKEYDTSSLTGTSSELLDMPGPYDPGLQTLQLTITKATVDAFDASLGGIISTNTQYANLLDTLLRPNGATAFGDYDMRDPQDDSKYIHDPKTISISTLNSHGDGNYVEIANVSAVGVDAGGLAEDYEYGKKGSGFVLAFDQFTLHIDGDNPNGVEVDFKFSINGTTKGPYNFNRTYVNELFGRDTGRVENAGEMVTLMKSLLDQDWPDLIIEESSTDPGSIIMRSDPAVDRKWGPGTGIDFSDIVVSIEPLPVINFLKIDIENNPDLIDYYMGYLEASSQRVIDAAADVGALSKRIDIQSEFTAKLMSTIDKGVGRLVDIDMNEASTRLAALQTHESLAIQTLSIANANSENVLYLFR